MYDKYFQANSFSIGSSKLPKHKGILFSGGTAGNPTATLNLVNNSGATIAASLAINQSPYILPMQVYSVTALSAGLTAWYIT
jgi:hypothetical protein